MQSAMSVKSARRNWICRSSSTIIPGDIIGKDGIEREYDSTLRGVDGERRVLVDSMGRERQVDKPKEAVAGKDLAADARSGSAVRR